MSSALGFRIEIFRSKTDIKIGEKKKASTQYRASWKFGNNNNKKSPTVF